jgi:translation initiation factor IF-1
MNEVLSKYDVIGLDEMKSVRLMNRIDRKYVATFDGLSSLLELACADYRVQAIDGCVNLPYYTEYFDTFDYAMYMAHLHGKKTRQKIRIRRYEQSDLSFVEIKCKSNRGRTDKRRITCRSFGDLKCETFIGDNSMYRYKELRASLENRFNRITLVNRGMTERVTIDTCLRFRNCVSGECRELSDVAVIELKRDGNCESQLTEMLRELRIFPSSFSKYCVGLVVTDSELTHNNFKPVLRRLEMNDNIVPILNF